MFARRITSSTARIRPGAHGTDWGSRISRALAAQLPDRVAGLHLTTSTSACAHSQADACAFADLTDAEREAFAESVRRTDLFNRQGFGYGSIQGSRPQTLAYALTDSPTGLLSWLVDKFWAWTDCTDSPEEAIDREQMLTNITVYWVTGTAGSAARLYYKTMAATNSATTAGLMTKAESPCRVPTGFAVSAHDNFLPLRRLAERSNNVVRWTEFGRGGHLPAMEQPSALVEDLRGFFRPLR